MKAFTNIEQSRKLTEILPVESADMRHAPFGDTHPWFWDGYLLEKGAIPCWSLAALLDYLREIGFFPEIDVDKCEVTMNIKLLILTGIHNIKVEAENFIDACYELIIKLHEQKLL